MKKIVFVFILLLAGLGLYAQNSLLENIDFEFVDIPGMNLSMSTTEVTQELYEAVMGENPSYNKGSKNPVEKVSWGNAIYFCNKLSEIYGFTPVYYVNESSDVTKWAHIPDYGTYISQNRGANGFRLPTFEEWKYAARGGEDYTYSGGDNLDEVAWFDENSGKITHPVAQKKANGYGLYDMSGNVGEWVWHLYSDRDGSYFSHYDFYQSGGTFYNHDENCKVDSKERMYDGDPSFRVGFRIVRNTANDWSENPFDQLQLVDIPGRNLSMSTTELTQELYGAVMGENPSRFKGATNPVEQVSWYDAIYFCNKLSEIFGYTSVYAVDGKTDVSTWNYTPHKQKSIDGEVSQNTSANGFRLPTCYEWEYAAKGGCEYECSFPGCDTIDEVGWYEWNSGKITHPVAQKKANGYGLYDMSGNVCEWCWNVYPNDSRERYLCGGCWRVDKWDCEVSARYSWDAAYGHYWDGFRIVRSTSN